MFRSLETNGENKLVLHLKEIFPDASLDYLEAICRGKEFSAVVLHELIGKVIEKNNQISQESQTLQDQIDFVEQLEMMTLIPPNEKSEYVEEECWKLIHKPEKLKRFMSLACPIRKDYLRLQQVLSQKKLYITHFNVDEFLKAIPDPISYFENLQRKQLQFDELLKAQSFLGNKFRLVPMTKIRSVFKGRNSNMFRAYKQLQNHSTRLKSPRKPYYFKLTNISDITLLQEITFIQHFQEITAAIEARKTKVTEQRKQADASGISKTCGCCYDDKVIANDFYKCENGCGFCKNCIRQGAEVDFGNGKLEFACLNACPSYFSLETLQAVLEPKMFSRLAQKRQIQEVIAADIEGLEMCPYCDFAAIPAAGDKIFHCLNPECMKETCRSCQEPAHIPLRCDEIEQKEDVQLRTYIENKMTEALLRKCYKCGIPFIKEDGCNRMACSCGAVMCYICGKPVENYKHFNGPGGTRFDLCPLYNDTNRLHEAEVLKGAEVAKQEKGLHLDASKLKIDPTLDIQVHYKEVAKKNPVVLPLGVVRARDPAL